MISIATPSVLFDDPPSRTQNGAAAPKRRRERVERFGADRPRVSGNDADEDRCGGSTSDEGLAAQLRHLTLGDVLRAQRRGAQLLDTRSPDEFASGHLADSIHIALGEQFASCAQALLCAERSIVLVCAPGREPEAAVQLRRAGLHRVAGYLAGGIEAVRHLIVPVKHPVCISSALLGKRLARRPASVVDVRAESEWRREAIASSVNIPLERLGDRIAEIPEDPVVLYCRTGERASTASSILEQAGRLNILTLVGGIESWKASGQNVMSR
jgi:hydroxyacylglutathione hydrolase